MPITAELSRKFNSYPSRDEAMLEIARHYLSEPGIQTDEVLAQLIEVPKLNDLLETEIESIISRVGTVNQLLPQAEYVFSLFAKFSGLPERPSEQANFAHAFSICNSCVNEAEKYAQMLDVPSREMLAALARIGVQMSIGFITGDHPLEVKSKAKSSLIYFTLLESLAAGVLTGAYQYCYVDIQDPNPELFRSLDHIRPIIKIKAGEDERRFKGSIAFGETQVEQVVVPRPGSEFYYIDLGKSDSSDPQSGEE